MTDCTYINNASVSNHEPSTDSSPHGELGQQHCTHGVQSSAGLVSPPLPVLSITVSDVTD